MIASLIVSTLFVFTIYIVGVSILEALGRIAKKWLINVLKTRSSHF